MTSQLVALATQSRNASGLDALDELLLDDDPVGQRPRRVSRQLALPSEELELEEEDEEEEEEDEDEKEDDDDDPEKQAPHLAMMLSTALSHRDGPPLVSSSGGQPTTNSNDDARTNPSNARFIGSSRER